MQKCLFDHGLVCDCSLPASSVEISPFYRVDWDKATFLDVGKKREASVPLNDSWVNFPPFKKQRCETDPNSVFNVSVSYFLNVSKSFLIDSKLASVLRKSQLFSVFHIYPGKLSNKLSCYPRKLKLYCPRRIRKSKDTSIVHPIVTV